MPIRLAAIRIPTDENAIGGLVSMKKHDEKVYLIYMEGRARPKEIIRATAELFDNFTLHPTGSITTRRKSRSLWIS